MAGPGPLAGASIPPPEPPVASVDEAEATLPPTGDSVATTIEPVSTTVDSPESPASTDPASTAPDTVVLDPAVVPTSTAPNLAVVPDPSADSVQLNVTVTPLTQDLGDVVNGPGAVAHATVTNHGAIPVSVDVVTSSVEVIGCDTALVQGSSCVLTMTLGSSLPSLGSALGPFADNVLLSVFASGIAKSFVLRVTGNLVGPPPAFGVVVAPLEHDFGAVQIVSGGGGQRKSSTITNNGSDAISVIVRLEPMGSFYQFTASCGFVAVLAPGESCTVKFGVNPVHVGAMTAIGHVLVSPVNQDNFVDVANVELRATGVREVPAGHIDVDVSPAHHTLGDVVAGSKPTATSTVTNNGPVPIFLNGRILTGPFIASGCDGTIPPGGSCVRTYRALFEGLGEFTATEWMQFEVLDNVTWEVRTVTFRGNVVAPALPLAVSPSTVDFVHTDAGDAVTGSAEVRNTSGSSIGPLAVDNIVTPTDPFAIVANGCDGATLGPGGTCTLTYSYTPPDFRPGSAVHTFSLSVDGTTENRTVGLRACQPALAVARPAANACHVT